MSPEDARFMTPAIAKAVPPMDAQTRSVLVTFSGEDRFFVADGDTRQGAMSSTARPSRAHDAG